MRFVIIYFLLLFCSPLFSQSKKELEAQVTMLKSEVERLKLAEAERLKKENEVDLNNPHQKASYALGVIMGSNLKAQGGDSLDIQIFAGAIKEVMQDKSLKIDKQQAMMVAQQYMQQSMERKSAKVREAGKIFLDENKKKEGVAVTPSGLQYKILKTGTGKSPTPNDRVTVHYIGTLIDGTEFDSSVRRGQPSTFGVTQVIRGWTEALQLMHEGDKWMLFVPQELGYGERGSGAQIPPYSTLVFEVELIKVN